MGLLDLLSTTFAAFTTYGRQQLMVKRQWQTYSSPTNARLQDRYLPRLWSRHINIGLPNCRASIGLSTALVLLASLWYSTSQAICQSPLSNGIEPFATIADSQYDEINLANGNTTIKIPIRQKGGPYPYSASLQGAGGPVVNGATTQSEYWQVNGFSLGLQVAIAATAAYISNPSTYQTCTGPNSTTLQYPSFNSPAVIDSTGALHSFNIPYLFVWNPQCVNNPTYPTASAGSTYIAPDGSGYVMIVQSYTSESPVLVVYDRSGNLVGGPSLPPPANLVGPPPPVAVTPNSLSLLTTTYSSVVTGGTHYSNTYDYKDIYDSTFITEVDNQTYLNSAPYIEDTTSSFSYPDGLGNTQSTEEQYSPYTAQTNFSCGPTNAVATTAYLVSKLSLPDGSAYTFKYEPTPSYPSSVTGRLAYIGLPDGGSISYTYTGGNAGVYCDTVYSLGAGFVNPVVPVMTRTITDGAGHTSVWKYSLTDPGPLGYEGEPQASQQDTVTDPNQNQTVYSFGWGYQTKAQYYQGSAASGSLLKTVVTCYNGQYTNCASPWSARHFLYQSE